VANHRPRGTVTDVQLRSDALALALSPFLDTTDTKLAAIANRIARPSTIGAWDKVQKIRSGKPQGVERVALQLFLNDRMVNADNLDRYTCGRINGTHRNGHSPYSIEEQRFVLGSVILLLETFEADNSCAADLYLDILLGLGWPKAVCNRARQFAALLHARDAELYVARMGENAQMFLADHLSRLSRVVRSHQTAADIFNAWLRGRSQGIAPAA